MFSLALVTSTLSYVRLESDSLLRRLPKCGPSGWMSITCCPSHAESPGRLTEFLHRPTRRLESARGQVPIVWRRTPPPEAGCAVRTGRLYLYPNLHRSGEIVIRQRYQCTVPPLRLIRWQGRATATRAGKEDAAPLQTSCEAEMGSSTSTGAASDGRWCWGWRLGASVVVSDRESRRSARVTRPGRGGRSTVPLPQSCCAPWPVPPRPHVASPEHRCHRAASPERRLLLAPRARAGAVPRRLARAHRGGRDWRGPHGGERNKMQRGHGVKRRKRKEEEKK
jgi:hypothetical protein